MSVRHTPGPWIIDDGYSGITQKHGYFVRTHSGAIWDDGSADGGVCSFADARLIAAAPDLLDFAQFVLRGLEAGHVKSKPFLDFDNLDANGDVPMLSLASLARSTVAKATGEQA